MSKKLKFENVKTFYPDVAEFVPEGADLERKANDAATMTAGENLTIEAVFSSPSTDRDGDIIYPLGCVSDYYTGTVIFNHDLSALPIGRCDDFKAEKDGLRGKIKLSETYAFARDVYGLVKEKILQGISIGFIPLETLTRGTRAFTDFVAKTGLEITDATERIVSKWEWIETSIVPIGCNRDALIYAMASKAFKPEDQQTEKVFGLDKMEAKTLIDLQTKLIEKEQALNDAKKALETLETKAIQTPIAVVTKAVDPNPALLSWRAWVDVLRGNEVALAKALGDVWAEAQNKIAAIDVKNGDLAEVSAQLDQILVDASSKADAKTKAEVQKLADQIFAGYKTGYDGVTPIKDIEKVDQWKQQFINDYMTTLQPDPNKPLQAQSIETYKNDFLRAAQAETDLPTLNMSESNGIVAVQATYGAQQDIMTALVAESGDLIQIKGTDDERTCDVCAPAIDQFYSVSGKSDNFPSFDSLKNSGWGHPHCRCIAIPVADPYEGAKTIKAIETKAIKPITIKVVRLGNPTQSYTLTPDDMERAKALALGRLV